MTQLRRVLQKPITTLSHITVAFRLLVNHSLLLESPFRNYKALLRPLLCISPSDNLVEVGRTSPFFIFNHGLDKNSSGFVSSG